MTRVRRNSPLKERAKRLAKRTGWKPPSIAVARKLAVMLHAIWCGGTEFSGKAGDRSGLISNNRASARAGRCPWPDDG